MKELVVVVLLVCLSNFVSAKLGKVEHCLCVFVVNIMAAMRKKRTLNCHVTNSGLNTGLIFKSMFNPFKVK